MRGARFRSLAVGGLLAALVPGQEHAPAAGPEKPAAAAKTTACVACHERQSAPLSAPVAAWRGSVHGKAGIGCEGCHGGDLDDERLAHSPSAAFVGTPRLREVPYMCGRCHAEIKDKHLGSVHGANGLPHCVTCHGSHGIQHPVPSQIITPDACGKCHPFEPAQKAMAMLDKARGLLADLHGFADRIAHIPGVTGQLERMQRELHLDRQDIVSTFHSFRIGEIEQIGNNVDRIRRTLAQVEQREVEREQHYTRERPIILAMTGFLVLAAFFGYFVFHGKGEVHADKVAPEHE